MTKRLQVPGWALKRKTFIGASLACGAVIALFLSAVSFASHDKMGEWLTAFFSSLILPFLLVSVLLTAGLRRIVLGPARKQTVPARWWVVAYVVASLPLFFAFVILGAEAVLAWALGWQHRVVLFQALILLIAVSVTFSFAVKTVTNAYLLKLHWWEQ